MEFWWTFAEITSIIMFSLYTFLPSRVLQQHFEIMVMKKCAAIPLYMHVQNLCKYNTVFYLIIFLLENHKHKHPKISSKI